MHKLDIDGDKVSGERETDDGVFGVEATLPAVVSVNEKIVDQPRFPSFKGIMAAKKKKSKRSRWPGSASTAKKSVGPTRGRSSSPPPRSRRRVRARR